MQLERGRGTRGTSRNTGRKYASVMCTLNPLEGRPPGGEAGGRGGLARGVDARPRDPQGLLVEGESLVVLGRHLQAALVVRCWTGITLGVG